MVRQGNDDVKIDVLELASEMAETLSKQPLFMPLECCIFQAPSILSRHNPSAYIPNGFSIGPFHYNRLPIYQATQKIKHQYLHEFISRPWPTMEYAAGPHAKLIALTEAVTGIQNDARKCYAEKLSLSESEFVQVLVFDGCFLVEFFRKYFDRALVSEDDPVFSMSCMLQYLYHDLIVLENQIPWMVLEPLFQMTKPIDDNELPLALLVVNFFSKLLQEKPPPVKAEDLVRSLQGSKHILDLLRNFLVKNSGVHRNRRYEWQPIPSATRLREAGIKFSRGSSLSILDIEFDKEGVLKIPQLLIEETTETVLRNLICLEQCCRGYDPVVTSYAVLMDNLINTGADMEILIKHGVVKNWLNIADATNFFNNLYDDTCVKENYYHPLTQEVREYCGRNWPRWRTVLMHEYFRHPWMLISVVVATLASRL